LLERNGFFETDYLREELKRRSVRGGAVTITAQIIKAVLQISAIAIIARILTPQDFGLVTMVTAITGFVIVFKDIGMTMATIQKEEINHDQISTIFWINLVFGILAMGLTAAIAPAIAWFYEEPRLVPITIILATGFFIVSLGSQHQALLRRHMRFLDLNIIDIIALLTSVLTAVFLGLAGSRYWALVFMQITYLGISTVGMWIACRWCPGKPAKVSGVRSMLIFSGNLIGHDLLNYIFRNLDHIIIGRFSGSFALGLYSKCQQILLFPVKNINVPIGSVSIPALSRLQKNLTDYKDFYLTTIYYISLLTMPIFMFLFVFAEPVIMLVLGDQWGAAIPFFRILCVAALFQPVTNTTGWLFVSSGRTDRMLKWRLSTIWLSVTLYVLGALIYGAKGVAYGYTISVLILTVPCIWYAQKTTNIGTMNIFKRTLRPIFSALSANGFAFLVYLKTENIIAAFFMVAILYPVLNCVFAGSLSPIKDIVAIINRYIFVNKKSS
jgi:O-antigen/teichoic acid export membrane protein